MNEELKSMSNSEIIDNIFSLVEKIENSTREDKRGLSNKLRKIARSLVDCSLHCSFAEQCKYLCNDIMTPLK